MQGVKSYEELQRNSHLGIIDWEYVLLHPEAKLAIQQRYNTDVFFREKIDNAMKRDAVFRRKFTQSFKSS